MSANDRSTPEHALRDGCLVMLALVVLLALALI
jgi:hypothetical protein